MFKSISLGVAEPDNAFVVGYPYNYDVRTESS
jgi:hypothetical protein